MVQAWYIGPDAPPLLRSSLEQLHLSDRCMAEIARHDPTIQSGNLIRAHPATRIAKDTLGAFRAGFRALGLEPPSKG